MRTGVSLMLGIAIIVLGIGGLFNVYSSYKVQELNNLQYKALLQRVEALEEKTK